MTAGSRTWPSSMVKNTTGLEVGTREMIGATEPPWIATGVGRIVVVVVLDVDVVVDPVVARRCWDLAACAVPPPDVIAPTSTHAPATATTPMTITAANASRLRLAAACRRIRRSISHALSCRTASGGCYADESEQKVTGNQTNGAQEYREWPRPRSSGDRASVS